MDFSFLRFRLRPPEKKPPPRNCTDLYFDPEMQVFVIEDDQGNKVPIGGAGGVAAETAARIAADEVLEGEIAKRILYDAIIDNVTGAEADSLRSVDTLDLPANSIHAVNLGSDLAFYRLRFGTPTGGSPDQVVPLDYDVSLNAKYWKLHPVNEAIASATHASTSKVTPADNDEIFMSNSA